MAVFWCPYCNFWYYTNEVVRQHVAEKHSDREQMPPEKGG